MPFDWGHVHGIEGECALGEAAVVGAVAEAVQEAVLVAEQEVVEPAAMGAAERHLQVLLLLPYVLALGQVPAHVCEHDQQHCYAHEDGVLQQAHMTADLQTVVQTAALLPF